MRSKCVRTRALSTIGLDELDPTRRQQAHAQEEPAMAQALNAGGAVRTFEIADRQLGDLEVQPNRSEEEIEVAEGVEVPEILPIRRDARVVVTQEHLRPAQRVAEALIEEKAEGPAEDLVPEQVQNPHCLSF